MGANALFVLPTSGEFKFSKVRDMYDQDAGGLSLSNYYRSIDTNGIVNSDTYHTDVNPFGNTAHSIPESGELKMSHFRGAFKEHRVTVAGETAPYNINPSTTEYRTYRYYVTGVVSSSTWDSNGNGISGMVVNVAVDNIRIIVHVVSGGKIGGGPGQGGGGGGRGAGGIGGGGGLGSQTPGVAGADADCTTKVAGGDGDDGSDGKRGGHCIEIVDYTIHESFHICNYGELIPGGGGGGGAGGGGGGGAGESGGGGGHGAYGYNEVGAPPPPPPPPSSDPRLKDAINKIGTYNGLNVYEWVWNDIATTIYGLRGREIGFLTTELDPEYIGKDHHGYGYIKNGTMISEALKEVRVTMTK